MTQQNPDTEAIHEIGGQSTLKPIIDSMREARDDRAVRTLICKFPSPAEFAKVGASSIYLYVTHKLKEMHLEDQVDIEVQCEPCKPDGPLNRRHHPPRRRRRVHRDRILLRDLHPQRPPPLRRRPYGPLHEGVLRLNGRDDLGEARGERGGRRLHHLKRHPLADRRSLHAPHPLRPQGFWAIRTGTRAEGESGTPQPDHALATPRLLRRGAQANR